MSKEALHFIACGIACHALVLIKKTGIFDILISKGVINVKNLKSKILRKMPESIMTALVSLEKTGVLRKKNTKYYLTELGYSLANYIGLTTMLFEGYGTLMAKGGEIAEGKMMFTNKLLNGKEIANASIQFSEDTVDPIVIKEIKKCKIKGKICDLGCGAATHLIMLCKETQTKGLGIELNNEAIKLAKSKVKKEDNISIIKKDITKINGIFKEVELLMQYFVMHDINPENNCLSVLNSYLFNFPNMKFFFYVDVVSPSDSIKTYMPGFDYVHGLQGIQPRTYENTLNMFNKSKYKVFKEIPIKKLPNTFLWILQPC